MVVGYIYNRVVSGDAGTLKKIVTFGISALLGGTIMVVGYLVYESVLYGFTTAALGIVGNITQAVGGGILAAPLLLALDRVRFFQSKIKENHK